VKERKPVGLLAGWERLAWDDCVAWDVCALKIVIPSGRVVGWEESYARRGESGHSTVSFVRC